MKKENKSICENSLCKRSQKKLFLWMVIFGTLVLITIGQKYLKTSRQKKIVPPLRAICETNDSSANGLYLNESIAIELGTSPLYFKTVGYNTSLTVVTGYISVGKYEKVHKGFYRSIKDYVKWAEPYKYLLNPLVVYTDSDVFESLMFELRNNSNMLTKIIRIDKRVLWPFSLRSRVEKLFDLPQYPKYYPGTTYPDYTCATNSKLPILVDGIKRFNTSYYCWLDAGYLKYLRGRNKLFTLDVPKNFNQSKIAVTRVYNVSLNVRSKEVFYKQLNWIAGGLFLGVPEKIKIFEKQYHETVLRFLSRNLMAPEQQVLYAMYSNEERRKHPIDVELQTYIPGSMPAPHNSPWHFLGYAMYKER